MHSSPRYLLFSKLRSKLERSYYFGNNVTTHQDEQCNRVVWNDHILIKLIALSIAKSELGELYVNLYKWIIFYAVEVKIRWPQLSTLVPTCNATGNTITSDEIFRNRSKILEWDFTGYEIKKYNAYFTPVGLQMKISRLINPLNIFVVI